MLREIPLHASRLSPSIQGLLTTFYQRKTFHHLNQKLSAKNLETIDDIIV